MKRQTNFFLNSTWGIDDIDDWATFCPPTKRARRVSTTGISSKSVRFAEENEVQYLEHSRDDMEGSWYTAVDWQDFRAECRQIVTFISKCNGDITSLDQERYSIRGLEEHISATLLRQSSPQRFIVRQIVESQYYKDQASLRDTYLKLSHKHRCRALRRAIGDARSAGTSHSFVGPTSRVG
jgi:hypothetical protein